MQKRHLLPTLLLLLSAVLGGPQVAKAQTAAPHSTPLFVTDGSKPYPYRIPAIACTKDGTLVALSDYRFCGSDIGYGRVDIVGRNSHDNGQSWGQEYNVIQGSGTPHALDCGYGDAALVADRTSNELLLICVSGQTVYWNGTRQKPMPVARLRSHDSGRTWSTAEDITETIYSLFDGSKAGDMAGCFLGSGRIFQSRVTKVGTHYRLYAALCARPGGNRVIYSDDFGEHWLPLGGKDATPAPQGDEPKCEELPDGTVILSSRMNGGRFFNFFTYTDAAKATGSWAQPAASTAANHGTAAEQNATNGEILLLPVQRIRDGHPTYLALQSVPLGPGRSRVGIYYKALDSLADCADPAAFAADWDGCYRVTELPSAYSTMVMQRDGRLAFFYEEATYGHDYTNVYLPLSLEDITAGQYRYYPRLKVKRYLKALHRTAQAD